MIFRYISYIANHYLEYFDLLTQVAEANAEPARSWALALLSCLIT